MKLFISKVQKIVKIITLSISISELGKAAGYAIKR